MVHSISVAYTEQDTNHMILQTFALDDNPTTYICLGKHSENEIHKYKGLDLAKTSVHSVEPAGVWETTDVPSIIGIRKCFQSPTPSSSASGIDNNTFTADPATLTSALKLRATKGDKNTSLFPSFDSTFSTRHTSASSADADNWEAWTLTPSGEFRSKPLMSTDNPEDDQFADEQLFVVSPGPITKLGKRSVAVGFGNTVKVITLGKESFDGIISSSDGGLDMGVGSYKWRARRGTGRKLQ